MRIPQRKKIFRKKLAAFKETHYGKILCSWLIASMVLGVSGIQLFTFNTPTAQAATSDINFNTEADYAQEDVKGGTITYYTQSSGAQGNLKASSGGANVNISSTKIKRGCRAIVAGTSQKIVNISNATTGLINFDSSVSSGAVTAIYCTTFNGSVAELGTGTVVTSSTTAITTIGDHRIAFDSADNLIFLSAIAQNLIKKFTVATETFASDISLTSGSYDVAYDSTNNAIWATDSGSYKIYKIDPNAGSISATYSSTFGAYHGAYSATGDKFFFQAIGKIKRVASGAIDETGITVGGTPRNMAYDPSTSSIWVSNNADGTVSKVNASTEAVTGTYTVGSGPDYIAYDSTQSAIWVANDTANTVTKLSASNGSTVGTYSVGTGGSHSIAYESTSNSVWITNPSANTITRLNASSGSLIGTYSVTGADDIVYDSGSQSIWVIDRTGDNLVRVASDTPGAGTATGYTVTTGTNTRLNAATWSSINSATVTETKDSQTTYYAISFDAGHTYKIWTGSAWRTIASDKNSVHGGTEGNWYYYNSGGTWVVTTNSNTANGAVSEAITSSGGSVNSMSGTTLGTISSANWSASGGFAASGSATIDVASFISSTSSFANPKIDNISFDYSTSPSIQFTGSGYTVAESGPTQTFSVILSTTSASTVTVDYTLGGTATIGDDYTDATAPSGTISIAAGSTTGTISIPIINDTIDEPNETITMTLANPVNATIGSTSVTDLTITDDDSAPTVQFSAATSSDSEGRANMAIPVTLSAASGYAVTVNYATADGTASSASDYTSSSGTLTFPIGSTTQYVPITLTDDTKVESDETITVTLSTPSANVTLGSQTSHTFTILDNDGYPSVGFSVTNSEVAEATGTASIAVALSKAPATAQDVVVNYAVTGGTGVSGVNYTLTSGTITLTSTTPVNITPTIIADSDAIDQTVIITLSSPTYATLGVNTVHTLTIKETSTTAPSVSGLTANGAPSPATLTTNDPTFAWNLVQSAVSGSSQRAYRFTLADTADHLTGGTYICDTGKVTTSVNATSNKSVIEYASACGSTLYAGTFYWRVMGWDSNDNASAQSDTQTLTISSILATPTACSASSTTSSSTTLTWTDNSSDETGFEIEQSLSTFSGMSSISDGNYHRIVTTAANAVSQNVTGLGASMGYYYRIRAVNRTGYSSFLVCSSSVRTLAATPNAPTVVPLSSTSLSVKIDPSGNSEMAYYAIGAGSQFVQANGTLGATAVYQSLDTWGPRGVTITGLSANTSYAINITGQSDSIATSASASTTAYTLAARPSIATSSPSTSGFSITPDAGSNPVAGTLIGIQVYDGTQTRYVQTDGTLGSTVVKKIASGAGSWATIAVTGLRSGVSYRIQAIAYNGDASQRATYSFTAAEYTATNAPTSFRVTALTTTSASLYVDTRTGYTHGFNGVAPTVANTVTNSGLTNNGVVANQTVLLNNGTDTSTVTMGIFTAVETPIAPAQDISARTPTSIKVALGADGNAANTEYQIVDRSTGLFVSPLGIMTTSAITSWATRANLGGAGGITIRGLSPGQDLELMVRARNQNNIETELGTALTVELGVVPSHAPTITTSSDSNGLSSAQLVIDTTGISQIPHVTFALYNATTNQYVQNTSGSSSGNGALGTTASYATYDSWGRGLGYTITGLSPDVTNVFAVIMKKTLNGTVNTTGFTPKTSVVTGVNKSLIGVASVTTSSIALQVNSSSNTEYSIELVPSSGSSTYLTSSGGFGSTQGWNTLSAIDGFDGTTDKRITISSLTPNTSYTFRIWTRNTDTTNGYISPAITIYTLAATPTSPTATAASSTRLNLSWNVNSNPAGTLSLISESSTGKYVVSNALSSTSSTSTFDNTTPTNTTYVDGLTANTQYCFTITSYNGFSTAGTATSSFCGTTSAATSSSSSGGGGGGSSSSTTTTTATTTTTTVTPTPEPTPVVTPPAPKPTPTPKPTPVVTPPAPEPEPTPAPATPTPVPTPTPTPATPAPEPAPAPIATGSGGSGGGGGTFVSDLDALKKEQDAIKQEATKQQETIKKEQEKGVISFLGKNIVVPGGAKAFIGVSYPEFYKKIDVIQPEKTTANKKKLKATAKNTDEYVTIDDAFYGLLLAVDLTEVEVNNAQCDRHIEQNKETLTKNSEEIKSCLLREFYDWRTSEESVARENPEQNHYVSKKGLENLIKLGRDYLDFEVRLQKLLRVLDNDNDKLTNAEEVDLGTDPYRADTDGDGVSDYDEVKRYKTDPNNTDTDHDGLLDGDEIKGINENKYTSSPLLRDTDSDGYTDGEEIRAGSNPRDPNSQPKRKERPSCETSDTNQGIIDSDNDGLSNLEERRLGTDPCKRDTDGDGVSDGREVELGTNPLIFATVNPDKKIETNIIYPQFGQKFADASFIVTGSAEKNSTVVIIAKTKDGSGKETREEIGRGITAENSIFFVETNNLSDGTYDIQALTVNENKSNTPSSLKASKLVSITINSKLKAERIRVLRVGNQDISKASEEDLKNGTLKIVSSSHPVITVRSPQVGSKVRAIARSAISTAVLISDTPSDTLEIRPPEELELGDHEFTVYAINEDENIVGPATSFRFKVTDGSSDEDFRIKSRSSDDLISFLRQKTARPIFEKILIGIGILLALWGLISLYQKRKRG